MRIISALAFALAGILLVVACAGGGGTASPQAPAATQTAAAPTPPQPTEAGATVAPTAGATSPTDDDDDDDDIVRVADSEFGQILVDADGRTLYGFVPDEESGESTCYDQCAEAWPPLLADDDDDDDDDVEVGDGLDDDDFSTVERTDGTTQVRIGTYPLYYFANDAAPGDTNGQGLQEVWFVVSPEGELIRDTP